MSRDAYLYIMGPLPPPIGGVTIFVKRRSSQLRRQNVPHEIRDWNLLSWPQRALWLLKIIGSPRKAVYELNGLETLSMLALLVRPFPKRIVYWVHSGQFSYVVGGFHRWLFKRIYRATDEMVFVSEHIPPMFRDNGFHIPENHRVQHAFIEPDPDEELPVWKTYEPETRDFIEARRPLLAMQGSYSLHEGVDRYGTDLGIECVIRLAERYPNLGLVIGRPSAYDAEFNSYCEALDRRIEEADVASRIHFVEGERDLWPITKRADVFLRPSNQDGDSISVREAMHFDVPVVAADACPRPDGVVLFENRNADDLAAKVDAVLQGLP